MSWQKSVFYEVNDWRLEPGNGVETNAFDDGGVFGEKHCNDGENENSDTENGDTPFDYSTLKTMINKKHFKICYGFEPSMQGYDQIKQNIKNSRPKVLQLGNNNVSILLKNKTIVTEIGKKNGIVSWPRYLTGTFTRRKAYLKALIEWLKYDLKGYFLSLPSRK